MKSIMVSAMTPFILNLCLEAASLSESQGSGVVKVAEWVFSTSGMDGGKSAVDGLSGNQIVRREPKVPTEDGKYHWCLYQARPICVCVCVCERRCLPGTTDDSVFTCRWCSWIPELTFRQHTKRERRKKRKIRAVSQSLSPS
jgi:hypothetical protein